jgi:DNA repair photolyase
VAARERFRHEVAADELRSAENEQSHGYTYNPPVAIAVAPLSVRSALTPTGGYLHSFTHSLNPYSGCVFGCPYCYVRQGMPARLEPLPWGRWVKPKLDVAGRLDEELARAGRRGRLGGLRVFLSSATDPYQPQERRLGLTRACLEAFARRPPGLLVVQTRSPLVARDLDVLVALRERVWVSMSVETDDEAVRRAITPACPPIPLRLEAMERLLAAGLRVQAAVSPVLPHRADRLVALVAPRATRVVVDTFVSGDGSGGKRTGRNGIPALWERLGYGDWSDERAARALHAAFVARLGAERVTWSRDGFNGM